MNRVLIVDDKEDNLYYLSALLGAHGFEVRSAQHGAEALSMARQSAPDIIVSDLLMPVMDGYTLLSHWKADPRLRQIPFIVYTATYTEPEDEQLALRLGADAFILKPAEPDAFLERIREVQAKVAAGTPVPPQQPIRDETGLLREYSETLIRKLEEKSLQLEETNRSLQRDIAARQSAEAALRESEAKFRLLTEAMPQMVWITRADGGNIFSNQRWVQYTGLSLAETAGTGWTKPLHPDDKPRAEAAWKQAIESGGTYTLEGRLRRIDGNYHWWLMRGLPMRDDTGTITNWFGTCTDIDDLKTALSARDKAEREASERAALLDALFDSVPDTVTHLGLDGRIRLVNRLLPTFDRTHVIGALWTSFVPIEQRDVMTSALDAVVAKGKATSFELNLPGRDGATRAHWNTIAPVVRDGVITGAVLVSRDITERKQTESQLIVSDRMASVGTLAAGVAHEINNPLASVTANLALASRDLEVFAKSHPVPPDLIDELQDARSAAERVRMIVRDLKIFSRGDEATLGPVDVEQVLESTLRMAWNELRHRARLVKIYGKVPPVQANESRLGQVMLNLVVNAAQAIPEGNYNSNEVRVETKLDSDANRVLICITDTGPGIPVDVQRRLFTPFFTTKPVGVGTGLGLSICHRIVTSLGGTIDFSSQTGKGTTFTVSLPLANLDVEPEPTRTVVYPSAARRRGSVLVIDDDVAITTSMRRLLSSEHDLSVAPGAEKALELFKAGQRFDVVLCDLMMPQMTGMELHAQLLQLDPKQASRVVFMTGGAFTPTSRTFLDTVSNQRIEKPFDIQGLRALVNGMVS